MKKFLFFTGFGLAFLAGFHLGKRDVKRRYPSLYIRIRSDKSQFNSLMDQMQAHLEKQRPSHFGPEPE